MNKYFCANKKKHTVKSNLWKSCSIMYDQRENENKKRERNHIIPARCSIKRILYLELQDIKTYFTWLCGICSICSMKTYCTWSCGMKTYCTWSCGEKSYCNWSCCMKTYCTWSCDMITYCTLSFSMKTYFTWSREMKTYYTWSCRVKILYLELWHENTVPGAVA